MNHPEKANKTRVKTNGHLPELNLDTLCCQLEPALTASPILSTLERMIPLSNPIYGHNNTKMHK